MPYPNEQIEQWAEPGWNEFHKGTNAPKWNEFSGAAKDKQLNIAHDAATRGASAGNELEMAYEAAYQKWIANQPKPTNPLPDDNAVKPAKAVKK